MESYLSDTTDEQRAERIEKMLGGQQTERYSSEIADLPTDRLDKSTAETPAKSPEEVINDVKVKAEHLVSDVREKSAQAAERIDSAMTTAGERMTNLAQTVRDYAPDQRFSDLTHNTVDALERGGTYLRDSDLNAVRDDLAALIRRYPLESLLTGIGVGFALAWRLRK